MLDLNLLEKDFVFDTDNLIIKGTQGNKPCRRYTAHELYIYARDLLDQPDMMAYPVAFSCMRPGVYCLINGWSLDANANASLYGIDLLLNSQPFPPLPT